MKCEIKAQKSKLSSSTMELTVRVTAKSGKLEAIHHLKQKGISFSSSKDDLSYLLNGLGGMITEHLQEVHAPGKTLKKAAVENGTLHLEFQ